MTITEREGDEENWEKLRDYWRRNTERLEYKIDQIADGRSRLPFDRLPRTNYTKIINRLEARGYITHAAAEASRELNALFNAYRPRNTRVRSEMLGPLLQLDFQLDRELVPYAAIQGNDVGDAGEAVSREPAATPVVSPPMPSSPINGLASLAAKLEDRPH